MNEQEKQKRVKINIDTTSAIEKVSARRNLGISEQYDRKKFDCNQSKKRFKSEQYKGKKVVEDSITGRKLHSDHSAAKRKYKSSKYAQNVSETDHIIALKEAYNKNKYNPFLSDDDLKRIYNKKNNYELLSKKMNAAKGGKSNLRFVLDELKKPEGESLLKGQKYEELIKNQVKSSITTSVDVSLTTLKNMNEIGVEAGSQAVLMGGTVSLGRHSLEMIKGEECIEEAAIAVGLDAAKSGASAYTNSICTKGVSGGIECVARKATNKELAKKLSQFAKSDGPAKVVTITVEASDTIIKYIKGEITAEETVIELGQKGTALACSFAGGAAGMIGGATVGMLVGMVLGGVVGSIVPGAGTVIGAEIGSNIGITAGAIAGELLGNYVGYLFGSELFARVEKWGSCVKLEKNELRRLESVRNQLANQIERYTFLLAETINQANLQNEDIIINSFYEIRDGIVFDDINIITGGLNRICNQYGVKVRFKTREEFDEYILS